MQENIKYILEVFWNLDEKKRLIYIDVINDLIETHKSTIWEKKIDLKNLEKTESTILLLDSIKKLEEDITEKWYTEKELKEKNEVLKETLNLNYQDFTWDIWFIAFDKLEEVFFRNKSGKRILEKYPYMNTTILNSINSTRHLFLYNLEKVWIITRIHPKNEKLDDMLEEVKDLVMSDDGMTLKPLEDIDDEFLRQDLIEKTEIFWKGSIDEPIRQFVNLLEVVRHYIFNIKDLELLYEKMTGKKVPKKEAGIEYIDEEIFVKYDWKNTKPFEKFEKPWSVLMEIFKKKNKWKIDMWVLFQIIYNEQYIGGEHQKEMKSLRSAIDYINRKFRLISWWKNLLQIKQGTLIKLK